MTTPVSNTKTTGKTAESWRTAKNASGVQYQRKGNTLYLKIDMDANYGKSKAGNMRVVAKTDTFNTAVIADDIPEFQIHLWSGVKTDAKTEKSLKDLSKAELLAMVELLAKSSK